MSNIYKNTFLVGIISSAIFLIFFIEALFYFGMGMSASFIWAMSFAGLIAAISIVSSVIRYQLNQRAFQQKHKAKTTSTHQKISVELDVPFDTAFDLCLAGLETLDGKEWYQAIKIFSKQQAICIHEKNRNIGEIQVGLRPRAFGITNPHDYLKINIKLRRIDPLTTQVEIDSKPYSNTVIYDYGMSHHIVNSLAIYLRRESIHNAPPIRLCETGEFTALDDMDEKEMRYGGW